MFYDYEIEVWNLGEGYKDEDGFDHKGDLALTKTIMADVQPYSTERLKKDYGWEIDVTKRVFCDLDSSIKINTTIKYKDYDDSDLTMKVKKIIPWDDYLEVFCLDDK